MPFEDRGLTQHQVKELLSKFGLNKLPETLPPSAFKILLSQLKSPLVYVLVAAGIVTIFLKDYNDALIIFLAVLINTVFGFVQEFRANKALEALKRLIQPHTEVVRNGKLQTIQVIHLVPGDIVILNSGDKIPADGKLIFANRFFVNESILTGESVPVTKQKAEQVYMGTIVISGAARLEVLNTGSDTQIGKIAQSVGEISLDTPLRRQLSQFSKYLVFLVLGLMVFVILLGLIRGSSFLEIFTTSVALSVSAIPEGLLVSLTVVLAIGMQRILKRQGLVRNLVSAETLGGVTTICVDKTGTLTQGKMVAVKLVGDKKLLAEQAYLANDLDDPMVVAAYEWAKRELDNEKYLISNHSRIDSIPFSSEDRYFASLNHNLKSNILFVNGAPEFLIGWSELTEKQKKVHLDLVKELTNKGYRLVGFARKNVDLNVKKIKPGEVKHGLEWVGLLAFSDPVREGVRGALEKAKTAGIKIVVITGDYPQTATHVMQQLGLEVDMESTILGSELEKLSTFELKERLKGKKRITLFARTTPAQKLKIVESLKKNGEVVAMMGDGVNDAPALARADIGIVVGEATDVAKESADLVLLDSSFETIVSSVEEGRGIFDNIRKIILYLMSDAFGEIIAVVIGLLAGLPLPVTAAQILWINIVSDGFPNIALTVDPKRENAMFEKPRNPKELLVTRWMMVLMGSISFIAGLTAILLFVVFYNGENLILARSIAFAVLGVNSLVYVFSIRNLQEPVWAGKFLKNKWLLLAVAAGFILQAMPFYITPLQNYFEVVPLSLFHWGMIVGASIIMFVLIEISKVVFRKKFV